MFKAFGVILGLVISSFFVTGEVYAKDTASQVEAIKAGNWSKAETILLADLKESPDDVFSMLNLAYVYQRMNKMDDAIDIYTKIMEADNNPRVALASGKGKRAKAVAKQALAALENVKN